MFNNGFYAPDPSGYQTPFFFDKIYEDTEITPQLAETDGVFIGRFILTRFTDITNDNHEVIWQKAIDNEGMYYQKIAKIGVEDAIEMIKTATINAEQATKDANEATIIANEAANEADNARIKVEQAITNAEQATRDAEQAAMDADEALQISEIALINAENAIDAIEKTANDLQLYIAWQEF